MLLDPFRILQSKFLPDDFHISYGVDVALDVDDLGVVESTNHLEDAIHGPDMG